MFIELTERVYSEIPHKERKVLVNMDKIVYVEPTKYDETNIELGGINDSERMVLMVSESYEYIRDLILSKERKNVK